VSSTPTIYFIDDSATMREVIKIAFRRENINVVAYNDAASALSTFEQSRPDVVITDVIMPDKDGYEVCQFIKQHPTLGNTPVILMSGVVNRAVAEKAFSVKADELIRKPFQPQDLITRVRHLLQLGADAPPPPVAASSAAALSSIFQAQAAAPGVAARTRPAPVAAAAAASNATLAPTPMQAPRSIPIPAPIAQPPTVAAVAASTPRAAATAMSSSSDIQKLRLEVLRLEGLVKKLQSELQAEREYSGALEAHVKTLQDAD
jgi:CheY-like chemotaxis protein